MYSSGIVFFNRAVYVSQHLFFFKNLKDVPSLHPQATNSCVMLLLSDRFICGSHLFPYIQKVLPYFDIAHNNVTRSTFRIFFGEGSGGVWIFVNETTTNKSKETHYLCLFCCNQGGKYGNIRITLIVIKNLKESQNNNEDILHFNENKINDTKKCTVSPIFCRY